MRLQKLLPLAFGVLILPTLGFSQTAEEDTSKVYESKHNLLLEFPQKIWDVAIYPLGEFVIWEEKHAVHKRVYDFFTFHNYQIGIFPFLNIGGETGTSYGATTFWRNFLGKNNGINGQFLMHNKKNWNSQGAFTNPDIFGSNYFLNANFLLQKTENTENYTSGFFHDSFEERYEDVVFGEQKTETELEIGWNSQNPFYATYLPETKVSFLTNYNLYKNTVPTDQEDFIEDNGELTIEEKTFLENTVNHNDKVDVLSFGLKLSYDSRDFRNPSKRIEMPLNYKMIPGLVAINHNDKYYFQRNLGYPENGILANFNAKWNQSLDYENPADDNEKLGFLSYQAEFATYFTTWTKFRILALRAKLQKINETDPSKIPFATQFPLSDNENLRGFDRGAFRGIGTLLLSAEYRWPIWDTWSAFLYLDEGQVFNEYGDIEMDNFEYTVGMGLALWTERNFICRTTVSYSEAEPFLLGFSISQGF